MAIVREAAKIPDAVHFEVGQPDLPPPPGVVRALRDLPPEAYGYTPSAGLPALRERIAAWYAGRYGVKVPPERIFVTPGSSVAFLAAYLLALEPGERVVLGDPSYPCYANFARMVDAEARFVPLDAGNGFLLRAGDLEPGDRAVHVANPANPTGTMYDDASLEALAKRCESLKVRLLSDELYHGLDYGRLAPTALAFSSEAVVIAGFSKSFCMPGFRLGWIVVPDAWIDRMETIAQNLYLCAPTPMQYAALEAFDEAYLAKVRQTFRERRDWLRERIGPLFPVVAPAEGAFYLWCDASEHTDDATLFCRELLRKRGAAVTPGIDFGRHGTRTALRLAYTRGIAHMREGIERIETFLAEAGS